MDRKPTICIADDHTILREGLRALLTAQQEFEVVGEARDGIETIQQVVRLKPDLVLLDITMPKLSGIDALAAIKKRSPRTKVLCLSVHDSEEYVVRALQAGCDGYIVKDASHAELLMAIRSVLAGKLFISPHVSANLVRGYMNPAKPDATPARGSLLTPRERQLLQLIAEGYKSREIAGTLNIGIKTVETHRASLMRKLGVRNIAGMTAYVLSKEPIKT